MSLARWPWQPCLCGVISIISAPHNKVVSPVNQNLPWWDMARGGVGGWRKFGWLCRAQWEVDWGEPTEVNTTFCTTVQFCLFYIRAGKWIWVLHWMMRSWTEFVGLLQAWTQVQEGEERAAVWINNNLMKHKETYKFCKQEKIIQKKQEHGRNGGKKSRSTKNRVTHRTELFIKDRRRMTTNNRHGKHTG